MTTWTYAQLQQLWINNGGARAMAPLMAAIAMVESGGNDQAQNPSGATGLWQVEWPLHAGIVPCATSRASLLDPNCNARAAVALSGNNPSTAPGSPVYSGWLQWEPPGAYKAFMSGSTTPDPNVPAAASAAADLSGPTLGGTCIGTTFPHTSWCLKKTAARHVMGGALMLVGGSVAIVGVLVLVAFAFKASGMQRAVLQTAGSLGPAGRAVKTAGQATATRTGMTAAGRERRADKRGG